MASPKPLSETAFQILLGLAQDPTRPLHGYALIQAVNAQLGQPSLQPGALYTTLPKVVAAGLIEEVAPPADNPDPRRRYYRITAQGTAQVLATARQRAGQARAILDLVEQAGGKQGMGALA